MKIGGHDAIAATITYFAQMGIPSFLVYVVGYLEFIGGILVVLGAFACEAEGVLAIIMLFAFGYSYSLGIQVYMTPLAVLAALLALAAAGSGKFSLCPKARMKAKEDSVTM